MPGDGIEQFRQAHAVAGVGEQDRHHVRLIHGLLERRVQRVVVRLLAAQIFLHQPLVHLDDLIEDGGVGFGHREKSLSPLLLSRHSTTALPSPVGRLIGRHSWPKVSWICATRPSRSMSGMIDFVDDDRAGEVAIAGGLHHPAGDDFDAALGVDRRTATVSTAGMAGDGLADQIGAAGRVDEVDPLAEMIGVQEGGVDGMAVLLFLFFEIA